MISEKTSSPAIITVNNMSKHFGDFTAVDNLSMQVEAGKVHGFLGPNGSGKTTAIRMMCGLLDLSAGDVTVLGLSMPKHAEVVRDKVGYMTQRFSLYHDLTVYENLNFIAEIRGLNKRRSKERITAVLEEYNLTAIKNRLAGPLSGGQKRRLALAAAVLTEPKLLILDEPTSEVDPNTRRDMWKKFFSLAASGITILISTHLMDEAERCHRLTILNNGKKVADGEAESLKQNFSHSVLKLSGENVTALTDDLAANHRVIAVAQSGVTLRVIIHQDEKHPVTYIQNKVPTSYRVQEVAPTIEDIFVCATQDKPQKVT